MTITYEHEKSLYLNITNRCPNNCEFCVRTQADGFYADSLWLEREPSFDEITADIGKRVLNKYDSVVFCGYGEPTERIDDMLRVCRWIREQSEIKIRVNTNGLSDLINKRRTAPDFKGLFDIVSISLNAADAEEYDKVCHSVYGREAFDAMLSFAADVKNFVPEVVLSVVEGTIPEEDIKKCGLIAEKAGVKLRIREYIKN
ncbi:MAG: TIGR04100 family radical SAM protein [Firmicutes bacterium]|nr:TIGR04100 family radical SAM protein [Bacillota bacterium]